MRTILLSLGAILVLTPATQVGAAEPVTPSEDLPGAAAYPATLRRELAAALGGLGPGYVPRTAHRRDDGSPRYTNRLLLETSPYLRQHAHNPVDWRPWGDEAFDFARASQRPVFVSIGYSTCHWCHVMEEESFDDVEIARLLNEHFVAIKVDRETRPDVDAVYMTAITMLTGSGGWPLNVFLTPDREPFYGGTYFPPTDRGTRAGLPRVLEAIRRDWESDPEPLRASSRELGAAVRAQLRGVSADATRVPDARALVRAMTTIAERADRRAGGARGRVKFPSSVPLRFLLRYHRRTGDPVALDIATVTLENMAAGGIHDQIGGGFHRYATDPAWLVPHFEKMLYDNALLALTYLEAWQLTGREDFGDVTRGILDYVLRDMTSPRGGFHSATDADSLAPGGERVEGWYFTWSPGEIEQLLGRDGRAVSAWYGLTPGGNFEGRSILHRRTAAADVAKTLDTSPEALAAVVERARPRLLAERARRQPPLLDDKVLAAWNGLMIQAFARAGFAFDEPAYTRAARRAGDFVWKSMRTGDRLRRMWRGGVVEGPAFLEDYAFLIAACLDLAELGPDPVWLRRALALQAELDAHYADDAGGGYFATADDHEVILVREKPTRDGATPSGNSVEAENLLRLAAITGDEVYRERAVLLFSAFHDVILQTPSTVGEMLLALDHHLDAAKEIVLVHPTGDSEREPMTAPLRRTFLPNRTIAVAVEGEEVRARSALEPLLLGKTARDGRTTAYVCRNRVCALPTTDPEVFTRQLAVVEPIEVAPR